MLHVIRISIYVNYSLKFIYWIATDQKEETFPIGEGQIINIYYREDSDEIRRHGTIKFSEDKWILVP